MSDCKFKVGQKVKVKSWNELELIINDFNNFHDEMKEYIKEIAGGTFIIERISGSCIYLNADKNGFTRRNKHYVYLLSDELEPAGINLEIDESLFQL